MLVVPAVPAVVPAVPAVAPAVPAVMPAVPAVMLVVPACELLPPVDPPELEPLLPLLLPPALVAVPLAPLAPPPLADESSEPHANTADARQPPTTSSTSLMLARLHRLCALGETANQNSFARRIKPKSVVTMAATTSQKSA